MSESPVVGLVGARQVGKTTLARLLFPPASATHLSLDDPTVLDLAQRDPVSLLRAQREPVIVDEAQQAPGLFPVIKLLVDERREPGRFLLLGSANFTLMTRITESLAGRIALLELGGLSWAERHRLRPNVEFWQAVADAASLDDLPTSDGVDESETLGASVARGGMPPACLDDDDGRRERWLADYVRTYLERDVRSLTQVASLTDFRRMMGLAALRSAQVLNVALLARDAAISPSTARNYLGLLETSFQLRRLPAFAPNLTKRLTKAPKLHFRDTAVAWHLTGVAPAERHTHPSAPALAESHLVEQIATVLGLLDRPCQLCHWRSHGGAEVDLVLEFGERLIPVEIKTSARVGTDKLRGLASFLADFEDRAPFGIVFYGGRQTLRTAENVMLVPWNVALGVTR